MVRVKIGKMFRDVLSSMFGRPVTVQYLTKRGESVPVPPSFRGTITYSKDQCVGCLLCIRVCPSGAITAIEGRKVVFDMGRCLFCGQCAEICPKNAIRLSPEFDNTAYERSELSIR
ncbi:MAG: 4Fe-4S binding protein [Candidatus Bathyarchaeia archaeon]